MGEEVIVQHGMTVLSNSREGRPEACMTSEFYHKLQRQLIHKGAQLQKQKMIQKGFPSRSRSGSSSDEGSEASNGSKGSRSRSRSKSRRSRSQTRTSSRIRRSQTGSPSGGRRSSLPPDPSAGDPSVTAKGSGAGEMVPPVQGNSSPPRTEPMSEALSNDGAQSQVASKSTSVTSSDTSNSSSGSAVSGTVESGIDSGSSKSPSASYLEFLRQPPDPIAPMSESPVSPPPEPLVRVSSSSVVTQVTASAPSLSKGSIPKPHAPLPGNSGSQLRPASSSGAAVENPSPVISPPSSSTQAGGGTLVLTSTNQGGVQPSSGTSGPQQGTTPGNLCSTGGAPTHR